MSDIIIILVNIILAVVLMDQLLFGFGGKEESVGFIKIREVVQIDVILGL